MSVVNNLPDKVDSIFGMLLTVWLRVKPVGMRFTMSRVGGWMMKERRSSGATHSFRLSLQASQIVDDINHPVRLGGKSRKVSDAIEAYFGARGSMPSYEILLQNIAKLQSRLEEKYESESPPPTWRSRLRRLVRL